MDLMKVTDQHFTRGIMKTTKTVQSYKNTAAEKSRSTLKNVKSGFATPIRIKNQNKECQPEDGVKSPWDFRCPQYDQRSSNFINAGTHYGVGHRQPVGHEGNPKDVVDVLPRTRMDTLQDDDLG
jgi:hypothetical protein